VAPDGDFSYLRSTKLPLRAGEFFCLSRYIFTKRLIPQRYASARFHCSAAERFGLLLAIHVSQKPTSSAITLTGRG
jgi:hypothetical protein